MHNNFSHNSSEDTTYYYYYHYHYHYNYHYYIIESRRLEHCTRLLRLSPL